MVKSVIGDVVTYYASAAYQYKTDGTHENTRKYYSFGNTTVAMRENGDVTWQLTDQINSTTITASADGTLASEIRYTAFGEIRAVNGVTVTDNKYTGQREEVEIGLYYYVARWYDPVLAHFIQADSMVPYPSSSLSFIRYAYVNFNPIRLTDPTGHYGWDGGGGSTTTTTTITATSTTTGTTYIYNNNTGIQVTTKPKSSKGGSTNQNTGAKSISGTNSSITSNVTTDDNKKDNTQLITKVLGVGSTALDIAALTISGVGSALEIAAPLGLTFFVPGIGTVAGELGALAFYNVVLNPIEDYLSLGSLALVVASDYISGQLIDVETVDNSYNDKSSYKITIAPDTSFSLASNMIGSGGPITPEAVTDTVANVATVYYDFCRLLDKEPVWGLFQFHFGP